MPEGTSSFTVAYTGEAPVDLVALTGSLQALSRIYGRMDSGHKDTRIFVREIRPGSIWVELFIAGAGLASAVGAYAAGAEKSLALVNRIIETVRLVKEGSKEAETLSSAELKDYSSLVEPAIFDTRAKISIYASLSKGDAVTFSLSSDESNVIQNRVERFLSERRVPSVRSFSHVLLKLRQANKQDSERKNLAVVSAVSERALRCVFATDEIKQRILEGTENPLGLIFVVDVEVMAIGDKAVAYKITALYDSWEDDDAFSIGLDAFTAVPESDDFSQ